MQSSKLVLINDYRKTIQCSELVELGRADVALDVLAKRGDWDRLWEVASKEKMSTAVVSKFIIMRVEEVCVCAA